MTANTVDIIRKAPPVPLHLREDDGLASEHVSSVSRWNSPQWWLDGPTKGQESCVQMIPWDFRMPGGTNFMDATYAPLLDAARRFVWSLLTAPGDGAKCLAPGSASNLSTGLKHLITWMIKNAYSSFAELTSEALAQYLDDLALAVADTDSDLESEAQIVARLRIIFWLWQQRRELEKAGIGSLPSRPWPGYRSPELARMIGVKAARQIPPLPDEVALPVLNAAYRMIGTPADDIIRLSRIYLEASKSATTRFTAFVRGRNAIEAFRFSDVDASGNAWREPLLATAKALTAGVNPLRPINELRRLVMDVYGAAVIIIQATTGMRISEVAGLPAGLDKKTGLPACVRVQPSASGLHELFILTSDMSKGNDVPDDAEWVLGMRLRGTSDIPIPVRAIQVLHELLKPWRSLSGSRDLLLTLSTTNGISRTADDVSRVRCNHLRNWMRIFVMRHVDLSYLPDTSNRAVLPNDLVPYRVSRGRCIKTHQWRKTLAHFVFNTDSSMIPALAQQFQHMSTAITEHGYLGRNQALFETFDSVRVQETTSFIYEHMLGRSVLAGRMGKAIEDHIDEIRKATEGLDPVRAWRKVYKIVSDDGIRLWFAPHGKCMPLNPAQMRCHEAAGTASWRNKEPNYEAREPTLCAGCGCFVLDGRHVPYWEQRYVENWAAWRRAERNGTEGQFRVVRHRAEQARSLLAKLQIDTTVLDRIVERELADV